jgi:NADH-quinone oxidoreductase subunit M
MIHDQTLLLCLLVVPLVTAAAAALLGPQRGPAIRWLALVSTLLSLAAVLRLAPHFIAPRLHDSQVVSTSRVPTLPTFTPDNHSKVRFDLVRLHTTSYGDPREQSAAIQFYIGLDGLNFWLILLTALLMVTCVLVSWTAITERVHEFFAWLFMLQVGMVGVFLAFDVILFYAFFELTLVPLFFLIGIWGGPQRQYAARKFFIYTFAGSVITLLGVIGIIITVAQLSPGNRLTFAIPELVEGVGQINRQLPDDLASHRKTVQDVEARLKQAGEGGQDPEALKAAERDEAQAQAQLDYWQRLQILLFLALICGFAIKVPLVPFHTWLPLAHVEAPTAGSVLLAGVLLKIGTYGFMRLALPLTPDAALSVGVPIIATLAVIGIIYGSFCALAQDDIKKVVAYSSVAHLGFCMLGMFALNEVGLTGSLLQMINHGLSTGALFLLVGMLYERYHTRKMADYGGMAARMKLLAAFMVFITMSSIGLPGLNGFLGEVLVLLGMYDSRGTLVHAPLMASLGATGVVLGAWYMLTMVGRVFYGPLKEPHHEGHGPVPDLNGRELSALVPIAVCCLALGVYPWPFFRSVRPEVQTLTRIADGARQRADRATPESPAPKVAATGDQSR